ncbi:MAG TPA: hypothetical protein PKA27_01150 [Fimbriimonadaceae bacterium]|nr:hypothetical protein [Fimbriimonadaceae bacterium]
MAVQLAGGGGTLEITSFGEVNQVNIGCHLIVIDRPIRFRGYHVNGKLISQRKWRFWLIRAHDQIGIPYGPAIKNTDTGARTFGDTVANNSRDKVGVCPVWTPTVVRRLAACGLKVQLGLGGEGPPHNSANWKPFNKSGTGGTDQNWKSVKRPPLGNDGLGNPDSTTAFVRRCAYLKNAVIAKVVEIYVSYGLNPSEWIILELGNEPAIGGAGAPPLNDAFYSTFGLDYATGNTADEGLWDAQSDLTGGNVYDGAAYLEFFTIELSEMDLMGLPCVSPAFTAKKLSVELSSFDQAATTGDNWIDLVRANNTLSYGLNCYYNAFDLETTGIHPELYVWPTLGPVEYAEMAVDGFDHRGVDSGDSQCIHYKMKLLRANTRINNNVVTITEAGVHSRFLGMTDDKANYGVGSRDANYFLNYEIVGQARLAYLDKLRGLDVNHVIHFTVSDTFTDYTVGAGNWKEIYGEIRGDIQIDVLPTLVQRTYLSAMAWAKRAGLPETSRDPLITRQSKGSFWNKGVRHGDKEEP